MKIASWQILKFEPWHDDQYLAEILLIPRRKFWEWALGMPPRSEIRYVHGQFESWYYYGAKSIKISENDFPGCSVAIAEELEKEYAWAERMKVLAPDLLEHPITKRPREIFKPAH